MCVVCTPFGHRLGVLDGKGWLPYRVGIVGCVYAEVVVVVLPYRVCIVVCVCPTTTLYIIPPSYAEDGCN